MRLTSLTSILACACVLFATQPASAQTDIKAIVVKHLTTSRDFTMKVADQMPEADYGFKLTPPQMSFAEQMAHLASDQAGLLAPFSSEKPKPSKPASMSKKDVIAFVLDHTTHHRASAEMYLRAKGITPAEYQF